MDEGTRVWKGWLFCFYYDNMLEIFAPFFFYVWNQVPWRDLQTSVLL